jgi:Ca2+-binding RTX toxin-like protein
MGGTGNDKLNGGAGTDTASYADMRQSVTVNLMGDPLRIGTLTINSLGYAHGADAGNDTLISIENVIGGYASDNITGDNGANRLEGGYGDDKLQGMGGRDVLVGGAGNDTLDGGDGVDTADYSATTQGVTVYLDYHLQISPVVVNLAPHATGAEIGTDTLISIEDVIGGSGRDTLYGDSGANDLNGGAGIDDMYGGRGNDVYHVDDVYYSGSGLSSLPLMDNVHEKPNEGTDTVYSSISYALPDNVENLVLVTNPNRWSITGTGNSLANMMSGTSGNDMLMGSGGADTLIGGQGMDSLYGNDGSSADDFARDTFVFNSVADSTPGQPDTINGFVRGNAATADRIDLHAIDANTATAALDHFHVVSHLTGAAGEIEFSVHGQDTWINLNLDANPKADMTIVVAGVTGLTADDLVL